MVTKLLYTKNFCSFFSTFWICCFKPGQKHWFWLLVYGPFNCIIYSLYLSDLSISSSSGTSIFTDRREFAEPKSLSSIISQRKIIFLSGVKKFLDQIWLIILNYDNCTWKLVQIHCFPLITIQWLRDDEKLKNGEVKRTKDTHR